MARVRDIEIDEVPEDVQPIYKQFATQYGPFLNQVRVFGHRPTAVKHIMGMLLDFKDEQVLPTRILEIALVVVSKLNECRYYAVAVTEQPNMIRDKMFDDLKTHFTEEQIVELTLRTALCGFFNRFNDALMIGMEDGVVADMLAMGAAEADLPEDFPQDTTPSVPMS